MIDVTLSPLATVHTSPVQLFTFTLSIVIPVDPRARANSHAHTELTAAYRSLDTESLSRRVDALLLPPLLAETLILSPSRQ